MGPAANLRRSVGAPSVARPNLVPSCGFNERGK